MRIPPQECIQCRLCEDACPYGAIREPTVVPGGAERRDGRRRLAATLLLLPVLVGPGRLAGRRLEAPLAQVHPTVQLAERLRLEETGQVEGTTDASEAFRNTRPSPAELYAEAGELSHRLGAGRRLVRRLGRAGHGREADSPFAFAAAGPTTSPIRQLRGLRPLLLVLSRRAGPARMDNAERGNEHNMTTTTPEPPARRENTHRLAVRIATVAGVFSLLVAALLLSDFHNRRWKEPFDAPTLTAAKQLLRTQPTNVQLQGWSASWMPRFGRNTSARRRLPSWERFCWPRAWR